MKIIVKTPASEYYGHIYEHIEYQGIYQIVFKPFKQLQPVLDWTL